MAAIGEVKADLQSIADDSYLTIQPASGEEWRLTNIYANTAIEVYVYDGTLEVLIGSASESFFSFNLAITNTDYIRVKNIEGSTQTIGYSAITTKGA